MVDHIIISNFAYVNEWKLDVIQLSDKTVVSSYSVDNHADWKNARDSISMNYGDIPYCDYGRCPYDKDNSECIKWTFNARIMNVPDEKTEEMLTKLEEFIRSMGLQVEFGLGEISE